MKIVLVSPPLLWEEHLRLSVQPPLNLLHLYSFLRARGVDVELLDVVTRRCSLDEAVAQVMAAAPDVVGVPLYYASLEQACALVSRLKALVPSLKTVAGGPCLTMEPERMMQETPFDFGVLGEGEETLFRLLGALDRGESPADIPGLACRQGGEWTLQPRGPSIADLDSLPYLDFSVLDNECYFRAQEEAGMPRTLFMTSSRGCSFRCTYCCTPTLWPGKIRRYTPQRLIEEIQFQLTRFPGVEIGLCDDSFFSDRKWLLEFIRLVTPLKITYQCIGRADHLTAPIIQKLVESGLGYLAFGVETGSAARQSSLRKNLDLKTVVACMKELSRYDIKTKCFFMLGFPDETPEEMAETINLASTLRGQGMKFFSIFPVSVYPGTELARQFNLSGYKTGVDAHLPEIIRHDLGIEQRAMLEKSYNAHMSYGQLVRLVTFAYGKVEQAEMTDAAEIGRVLAGEPNNERKPSQ